MIDCIAFIISFFLIPFLILIILIGVKFFYSLVTIGQSNNNCNEETNKQLIENSKEDSQADLYMSEENPDDNS